MKTLKLDHALAQEVLAGTKTSTWRLYDDKDLSVNDDVHIVDKVDPQNPDTWQVLGVAHIDSVVQKRLDDIDLEDYDGHNPYANQHEMIETFRSYYGPQVNGDTVVKIVRFTFNNNSSVDDDTVVTKSTNITEVKLYTDGGSRGNPGPSASGYVLTTLEGKIVVKKSIYLGITTNNQAEYQALKYGLEEAQRMNARIVHVYMDSLLVVNQMLGIFKVKNRDLWPIHNVINQMLPLFEHVSFTHIPRELNKIADAAVNEALDDAEN